MKKGVTVLNEEGKTRIGFLVPEETKSRLKKLAKAEKKSMTNYLVDLLASKPLPRGRPKKDDVA